MATEIKYRITRTIKTIEIKATNKILSLDIVIKTPVSEDYVLPIPRSIRPIRHFRPTKPEVNPN
jgi:hypothetical protein